MMHRRSFLKLMGFGTATLTLGAAAFRVGAVWWDQTNAPDLRILSPREAVIVGAMGEAIFPGDDRGLPSALDVGVVQGFDRYLTQVDELSANFLRLVLHAIDESALLTAPGLSRFHRRTASERLSILQGWDSSRVAHRRMAFRAVKFILATVYCEHPAVLAAANIDLSCQDL